MNKALTLLIAFIIVLAILLTFMAVPGRAEAGIVDTTRAVIHHTASHDVSASTIDKWHKERGWDGIGYHFVIRESGQIEKGRDIHKKGAHAKGRNQWIGIALTGYDKFTRRQVASLRKLLTDLGVHHIEKHHENCPGNGLDIQGLTN